jgi:chromate reductase
MQYHLRQAMVFLDAFVLNNPEVIIGHCAAKRDEKGGITDETTRSFVRQQLEALAKFIGQVKA